MFRNPFDGARAKIERSHAHFQELIAAEREFGKAQALTIEIEPQPNGDTIVFAKIAILPTSAHEAIVADIVGNFRASLDIAVSQACRIRGETDPKKLEKTYFAFGGSEKDWTNNLVNRMAGADQLIRDTVKDFRPWKEDGNVLYALSKIVANDKHVDLVTVSARTGEMRIDGLKLSRGDGLRCGVQGRVPVWGSADRVDILTVLAPAKVEISGPCVIEARFGFGDVYAVTGSPVIPTLHQMGNICEKIVDALDAAVS